MENSSSSIIVDDSQEESDVYDIQVFLQLCEVAIGNKTATGAKNMFGPRRDNTKTKWKNIQRWLEDNPQLRHAACAQQGKSNATPLHILCQQKSVPYDIIETVIESAPEVASWEDSNGWLPLHYACAKGATLDVLKALVHTYPEGQRTRDQRLRTPLHFCFHNTNENRDATGGEPDDEDANDDNDAVERVLLLKGAIDIPDEKRRLPIHFAAAYGTTIDALEELINAYPESVYAKEDQGMTPLHYAMANAHNESSPPMLETLLSKMNGIEINSQDENGKIPLQLLSTKARSIHESGAVDAKQNASECLEKYLDAKPKSSADFLTTIQSLPEWLRDKAVTHSHVKEILNHKISNRFPTSILILDGYFYILTLICFSHTAQLHIKYCFQIESTLPESNSYFLTACLVGASYFLSRELSQIISTINLGTFQTWILNLENWLDLGIVVNLFFLYFTMKARQETIQVDQDFGSDGDKLFRVGTAITIGAIWAATISFLKSCSLEFSLFFETVLYVSRKIFIYLIVLVVVLIAFSQMFLIVYKSTPVCSEKCSSEGGWSFPHCTFTDSFIKLYTMMLGEIGEVNRYQHKFVAQVMYVAFVFTVVILLSNVLIAMVTESHTFIKNERAEMVFWYHRLDFVAEMDTIVVIKSNVFQKLSCLGLSSDYNRTNSTEPTSGNQASFKQKPKRQPCRRLWENMTNFVKSDTLLAEAALYEVVIYCILKAIVVIIIIPLWIILGIATAGWFFPPQVREWLFVMKDDNNAALKLNFDIDNEIDTVAQEVEKGRSEMRTELAIAREDCRVLRDEIEDMKISVTEELKMVRDLTDTLLQYYGREQR